MFILLFKIYLIGFQFRFSKFQMKFFYRKIILYLQEIEKLNKSPKIKKAREEYYQKKLNMNI